MLTGETRYRLGWLGKIVLQVSEWQKGFSRLGPPPWVAHWRDATFRDVLDLTEGRFSQSAPDPVNLPPPPPPRSQALDRDLPPTRKPAPPMPAVKAPRDATEVAVRDATFYDVGIAAERGIDYRFLGTTGMEDQ